MPPFLNNPGDVAALTSFMALIGGGLYKVFTTLITMKENDLKHLDGKLEAIQKTVDSTEAKIDRHLEDHVAASLRA